jgi:hypothetical protein
MTLAMWKICLILGLMGSNYDKEEESKKEGCGFYLVF